MSIKGFIGFWSFSGVKPTAKTMGDAYKETITNGVSIDNERYTIVVSKDFLSEISEDSTEIEIGKCDSSEAYSMMTIIKMNKQEFFAKRDHWGTRTLYYCLVNNGFYFSSDIRFILSLPIEGVERYDENALIESATLGYILSQEKTLFAHIKQIPRNFRMSWKDGNFNIDRDTILSGDKDRFNSFDDAYEAFSATFKEVVASAAGIKGAKAFLLSGGMDSSALAIAASESIGKIDTISFASENNTEDVYFAKQLATCIKSNHTIIRFDETKALYKLPEFLNSIENLELEGIFSPLGGFAYYLLCDEVKKMGYEIIFPGEGADEILGGYYWQLTHTFGFVDRLKSLTKHTNVQTVINTMFPDTEEQSFYREMAYYFLQGTALTNYHLSCVEHSAKAFDMLNYPTFMSGSLYKVIKDVPMEWLCDGDKTKLLLRCFLLSYLSDIGLAELVTRKKQAMPSVVPYSFNRQINALALMGAELSKNPYSDILKGNKASILMLDIFHKYYTLRPLEKIDLDEWRDDVERIRRNEYFIHW